MGIREPRRARRTAAAATFGAAALLALGGAQTAHATFETRLPLTNACVLDSAAPAASSCGTGLPLPVGFDGTGVKRGIATFQSLGQASPLVVDAQLAFDVSGRSSGAASEVDAHQLTSSYGTGASWQNAYTATPWTTPGGDHVALPEGERALTAADAGQRVSTSVSRTLQFGRYAGGGSLSLLLKAANETSAHVDTLANAELTVDWVQRTGFADGYTIVRLPLSDGSTLGFDVTNDNVIVSADDFGFSGDARGLTRRYWNSLGDGGTPTFGRDGRGDATSVTLDRLPDGSYHLAGVSAADGVFVKQPGGSFTPPSDVEATLTELPGGGLTIAFDDGELWTFDAATPHRLVTVTRPGGYRLDVDPAAGTIADSNGREIRLAFDGSGVLQTATDENGGVRRYAFDGNRRLVSYTAVGGAQTTYTYSGGRLTRIDLPDGRAVKIAQDDIGTPFASTTITPVDALGVDQVATTYEKNGSWTYVTRNLPGPPDREIYKVSGTDPMFVTTHEKSYTPPRLSLSGALASAHETTLPPGVSTLGYTARTSGATGRTGVDRVEIAVDGVVRDVRTQSCGGGCGDLVGSWDFDTADYASGDHIVRITAEETSASTLSRFIRVWVP